MRALNEKCYFVQGPSCSRSSQPQALWPYGRDAGPFVEALPEPASTRTRKPEPSFILSTFNDKLCSEIFFVDGDFTSQHLQKPFGGLPKKAVVSEVEGEVKQEEEEVADGGGPPQASLDEVFQMEAEGFAQELNVA